MDRGFPGQELKKLLRKIGIVASPNCECNKRAKFMDTQGVQWCEDNIDTIVEWLKIEAEKRKLPFIELAAKILVKKAIANALKNIKKLNNKIFIQIACYRDPELIPTLKNLLENASMPDNLVICIAWQHSDTDKWDTLDEFKNDPRFKIIDINYKDSMGACWARNKIQQLYDNEDFTLQLDSHHRFIKDWDKELIEMFTKLQIDGYAKPLITSYIPSYDPSDDPGKRVMVPWKMNFDRFIPEGAIFFLPSSFDSFDNKEYPLKARFYSAHFAFTTGQFCKEVPHDPNYYFHGEEISIAVRAFTNGYDLFHPNKVIAWHEYTRKNRTKHWDDDKSWGGKNKNSHTRNRKLLGVDNEKSDIDFGIYGLGTKRKLRDYEKYAGISFSKRAITQDTIDKKVPPDSCNRCSDEEFNSKLLKIFKHCVNVPVSSIDKNIEYKFWAIIFLDENNKEIFRKDADVKEIKNIMNTNSNFYNIWRQFNIDKYPKKCIVWPYSKNNGWLVKQEFDI